MKTRTAIAGVIAGLAVSGADSAGAERSRTAELTGSCFEIVAAPRHAEPDGPILIDKCTGKTWLLVRHGGRRHRAGFRWVALTFDAAPRGTAAGTSMLPRLDGQKCFVFSGRRYCEE